MFKRMGTHIYIKGKSIAIGSVLGSILFGLVGFGVVGCALGSFIGGIVG